MLSAGSRIKNSVLQEHKFNFTSAKLSHGSMEFRAASPYFRRHPLQLIRGLISAFNGRPSYVCANCRRQLRSFTSSISRHDTDKRTAIMWQPRSDYLPEDKTEEFRRYPTVTSDILRNRRERPRRVKMLMRDFIEGQEISGLPLPNAVY